MSVRYAAVVIHIESVSTHPSLKTRLIGMSTISSGVREGHVGVYVDDKETSHNANNVKDTMRVSEGNGDKQRCTPVLHTPDGEDGV